MSKTEDIFEINRQFCSSNLFVLYRGAVPINTKDRWGNDHTRLDIEFKQLGGKGRKFHISIFDPKLSAADRITQSAIFHSLCSAVGTDFGLVPPCPGGFEEFVQEISDETLNTKGEPLGLLNKHKDKKIFIKLTINEKGYFKFGTGRCASTNPDLVYSEEDLRFLDIQQESLAELDEDTSFMNTDIPF